METVTLQIRDRVALVNAIDRIIPNAVASALLDELEVNLINSLLTAIELGGGIVDSWVDAESWRESGGPNRKAILALVNEGPAVGATFR